MKQSLAEDYLLKDWKIAIMSPIYKNKGAQNLAKHYRPISLTSIVCRLMEKLLKQQNVDHLVPKAIWFYKQKIDSHTTSRLLGRLRGSHCSENVVDVIYFDLAKAFDTVPHRCLLKRLQSCGIQNQVLE